MNQHNAAKFRSQTHPTTLRLEKNSDLKEVKEPPQPDPRSWEGGGTPNEQIWSQTGYGGAALREDVPKGFRWDMQVVDGEGAGRPTPLPQPVDASPPFPLQLAHLFWQYLISV